jgi:hypothetical protein
MCRFAHDYVFTSQLLAQLRRELKGILCTTSRKGWLPLISPMPSTYFLGRIIQGFVPIDIVFMGISTRLRMYECGLFRNIELKNVHFFA